MTIDPSAPAAWITAALDQFEGPLLRYALRLTGESGRARDVVQEVFLALCRQDPSALDGRLAPWLFRVCRTRAIDMQRQEQRMTRIAEMARTPGTPGDTPAASAAGPGSGGPGMLAALAELSPREQEILRLKFQAGLSYRQITEVTGLSTGNVGFIIHQALAALRGRLAAPGATTGTSTRALS